MTYQVSVDHLSVDTICRLYIGYLYVDYLYVDGISVDYPSVDELSDLYTFCETRGTYHTLLSESPLVSSVIVIILVSRGEIGSATMRAAGQSTIKPCLHLLFLLRACLLFLLSFFIAFFTCTYTINSRNFLIRFYCSNHTLLRFAAVA